MKKDFKLLSSNFVNYLKIFKLKTPNNKWKKPFIKFLKGFGFQKLTYSKLLDKHGVIQNKNFTITIIFSRGFIHLIIGCDEKHNKKILSLMRKYLGVKN